jgi:small subunit ribosomal protein S5
MDNRKNNRNNKRNKREYREQKGYDKKVVDVRRVAKVHKGGKRLSFSAMVVVGDKKGSVGVGLGKGVDTRSAIEKGERQAVKSMTRIELVGDTIPHEVVYKKGAGKVLLRPARPGTGIIAGSSVRTVLELAGIESVYGKLLGSNDPIINAYTTFEALKTLRNGRVLERMSKMRERVEMKKEMDKERKIKEEARRKAERKKRNQEKKKTYSKKKVTKKPVKKAEPKKEVKEEKKDKVSEKKE